jgi:hypothetical protein
MPPKGPGAVTPEGRPSLHAGNTCMLLVGDRVVLRATDPPDAEYAMFELAEIDLRSTEPGRVREFGYQTTVADARARLAQVGATPSVARDCALAMTPTIAEAYARGAAARHVARYLGPLEMFQSATYSGSPGAYHGTFLDLATLAHDLQLPGAGSALQALYLAVLLGDEKGETTVFLQTEAWAKRHKPGERTFKRPQLAALKDLGTALGDLAQKHPQPQITEQLARADVMAFIRARADAAPDQDARDLYASLERGISLRDMPDKGPLSDPDLWAVEVRLDSGALDGILTLVEQVEHARGRTPGTTYLRSRASLALHLEPPKLIAERVSALALSMTSFQELGILAAESWLEAGEPRRAMPYARDLIDAPHIDEGLLLRAQRVLARATGAAPHARAKTIADSMPAAPLPPSASNPPPRASKAPPIAPPDPDSPRSYAPGKSRVPTSRGGALLPPASPESDAAETPPAGTSLSAPPPPAEPARAEEPPKPSVKPIARSEAPTLDAKKPAGGSLPPISVPRHSKKPAAGSLPPTTPRRPERPARASVLPGAGPPPLDLELTPPPTVAGASFTLDVPAPEPTRAPSVAPPRRHSRRISHPPSSHVDPRAEPGSENRASYTDDLRPSRRPQRPSGRPAGGASAPPAAPSAPPAAEAKFPSIPAALMEGPAGPSKPSFDDEGTIPRARPAPGSLKPAAITRQFMLGASLPPFKTEEPAPLLPRAPLLPKSDATDELAEHLSLPPGVSTEVKPDSLPTSILEARVQFTLLARELGLDYRLRRGIELRSDVSGIEAMQAVLLESFPDHVIRTPEEAHEVRRHGAFLAEILARRLDAEWIDISPDDVGRWAMIVPPDTRVWPFGRIARLIQMGHKERDLVSYFLELQGRTGSR